MSNTILPPNCTQIPDVLLDMLPCLDGGEVRVVMTLARLYFGFGSLSRSEEPAVLAEMSNLRYADVLEVLRSLTDKELVRIEFTGEDGQPFYALNVEEAPDEL